MKTEFLAASREDTVELENNKLYRKVYIDTVSRADIAVAAGLLCRPMESGEDWNGTKWVMR